MEYKYDIVFTGSYNYHPEYEYRKTLIDWLKNIYKEKFFHFGSNGLPVVRGEELNKVYSYSKIVIGDTLCKNFNYPFYFSDRLFEVTGRGGFLIFPYIKGVEDHFVIGKELVTYEFNNFDDLKTKIDYYLERDDEREKIRLAGHERTKKDHTYTQRLKQLLNIIENDTNKNI